MRLFILSPFTCNSNNKWIFPRHLPCKTSVGRALHNVLVAILLSNTQQEQPCVTLCNHPGYISNCVLMANTTYCIKHNRPSETTAVFHSRSRYFDVSFLSLVQNVTFLPAPIPGLNWLSLSKAFCKARGLHCLDHMYHYTGSSFQIALHSFISFCKNMYIIP